MSDTYPPVDKELIFKGTWDDGTSFSGDVVVQFDGSENHEYFEYSNPALAGSMSTSYGNYDTSHIALDVDVPNHALNASYPSESAQGALSIELFFSGESPSSFYQGDETQELNGVSREHKLASSMVTSVDIPCYAAGTLIGTDKGNVAVECLAVGDFVLTRSGALRPIRWLGSLTLDCSRHPRPSEVMPVRIAAGAFGEGRPSRDLWLSPGHSVCVDVMGEVLVPAIALVDGARIVQLDVESVIYWHVELDSHDIIFAENLPAESYLEMGNRRSFGESGVVDVLALPDGPASTHADFCRPFVAEGPLLKAVKARLGKRAAMFPAVSRDTSAAA